MKTPASRRSLLLMLATAILAVACSGCAVHRWGEEFGGGMEGLKFHGKVGYACAVASDVVAVPVGILCLPVTALVSLPSQDVMFACAMILAPTTIIESVFYYAGALAAYPLYPLERTVAEIRLRCTPDERIKEQLLEKWPCLTRGEYKHFVRASGRECAAPYCTFDEELMRGWRRNPLAAGFFHVHSLISTSANFFCQPSFGEMDMVADSLERDWAKWMEAERAQRAASASPGASSTTRMVRQAPE